MTYKLNKTIYNIIPTVIPTSNLVNGICYFDTTTRLFKIYYNGSWY